ncbi:MAG: hypothetical protein K6V36_14485 [Anaerolineae bacterium]|nr:hypothetical protein [Anaerolineae bacterium]
MVRTQIVRRLALSLASALLLMVACACMEPVTVPELPRGTEPPTTVTPTRSPNQRDTIQAGTEPSDRFAMAGCGAASPRPGRAGRHVAHFVLVRG